VNFREAESYLLSLGNEVSAMKLGLENIRKLLEALGNPQKKYLKVQVAGTNGKGSVCAFLDSICNMAGIKTGTFTSPHLVSITERIRISGRDISEEDFARHANRVREQLLALGDLEYRPTFFEQITAIALIAFTDAGIELAILETGLGGRLDATTAANAEIAAITRIDLDHQEYLGNTIEEIAAEKAAIINAKTQTVIVSDQKAGVSKVIEEMCRKHNLDVKPAYKLTIDHLSLGLPGKHQIENAKVAVAVTQGLKRAFTITDKNVADGLANARHPGRLEYQGKYLFDGAHNVGGAKTLAAYLNEFEKRPITLVFGSMHGKSVGKTLSMLAPLVERIVLTEPSNTRSLSYEELLANLPSDFTRERTFATDGGVNAIDIAETITPGNGIILVTGSLYLVGEVKVALTALSSEYNVALRML
jgi:dihydrofolate synthase/folylpolyglutamate synthase